MNTLTPPSVRTAGFFLFEQKTMKNSCRFDNNWLNLHYQVYMIAIFALGSNICDGFLVIYSVIREDDGVFLCFLPCRFLSLQAYSYSLSKPFLFTFSPSKVLLSSPKKCGHLVIWSFGHFAVSYAWLLDLSLIDEKKTNHLMKRKTEHLMKRKTEQEETRNEVSASSVF